MYLNTLFVVFAGLAFSEPLLNRVFGKLPATFLLALSAVGLVSIVSVFLAEAM